MSNILKIFILFFLAITIYLFSCKEKQKEKQHAPQKAFFSGTWKYPEITSWIGFLPQSYVPAYKFNPTDFIAFTNVDSVYSFEIDCDSYKGGYIAGINPPKQIVFISSGDSLTFVADNIPSKNYWGRHIIFRFSGTNAAHYNYGYMSDSAVVRIHYSEITKENITAYKQDVEKYRDEKLAYLELYVTQYQVSDEFYDFAKSDIINEYINSLYSPLINKLVVRKDLPSNYFDETNYEPSNKLLYSYNLALSAKYLTFPPGEPVENNNFSIDNSLFDNNEQTRDYILNNFEGERQELLYSDMIGRLAYKQDINDYNTIKKMIEEAPKYVSDTALLNFIKIADEAYKPFALPIPDNIQKNTKLKSYKEDKTYTLKEVLDSYKGKAIYIDFWASWCGPCLADIKNSMEIKQFLEEQNIVYLYIAIRDKETPWKNTVKQHNLATNQYLLQSGEDTNLIDYCDIKEIPRYMLLNKHHEIIDSRAPRPLVENTNTFVKKSVVLDLIFK